MIALPPYKLVEGIFLLEDLFGPLLIVYFKSFLYRASSAWLAQTYIIIFICSIVVGQIVNFQDLLVPRLGLNCAADRSAWVYTIPLSDNSLYISAIRSEVKEQLTSHAIKSSPLFYPEIGSSAITKSGSITRARARMLALTTKTRVDNGSSVLFKSSTSWIIFLNFFFTIFLHL